MLLSITTNLSTIVRFTCHFCICGGKRGKEKVEKWALMQEAAPTTWWSIGRGTCMEVVRNQETHAGRSTAVKMIMASQITGPTCPAVTRCQITQPYVCSSPLPRLLASLSNRLGGTAPPTTQEKPAQYTPSV